MSDVFGEDIRIIHPKREPMKISMVTKKTTKMTNIRLDRSLNLPILFSLFRENKSLLLESLTNFKLNSVRKYLQVDFDNQVQQTTRNYYKSQQQIPKFLQENLGIKLNNLTNSSTRG